MRIALLLPLALLVAAAVAAADQPTPGLEPAWVCEIKPGIEWVASVVHGQDARATRSGEGAALLVATRDGHLQALDPATGRARWPRPLAVGGGVRLAQADPSGDLAVCFDRQAIYALRTGHDGPLLWRYGRQPEQPEAFPGDPETLTGWVAVAVTPAGVLAVNSDGGVVLLSREEGKPRWRDRLDRLSVLRLHTFGHKAVVVWRDSSPVVLDPENRAADRPARSGTKAAFLELPRVRPADGDAGQGELPNLAIREVGESWPLWSALVGDELVLLTPPRVTLWRKTGPPRSFELQVSAPRLAAIDVFVPPRGPQNADTSPGDLGTDEQNLSLAPCGQKAARRPLFFVGDGEQLLTYDLTTGRELRRAACTGQGGARVRSLTTQGEYLLVTSETSFAVQVARTGRTCASCAAPVASAKLLSCCLTSRHAYGLFIEGDGADQGAHLVRAELEQWWVSLRSTHPTGSAGSRGSRPADGPVSAFQLRMPADLREVVWSEGHLIVAAPRVLWGYALP